MENGTRHGEGTLTSADGSKWVGEYKNDKIWNITNFDSSGKVVKKWFHGVKQRLYKLLKASQSLSVK